MRRGLILFFAISAVFISHRARADDGYRLWLRYDRLSDNTVREAWSGLLNENGVTLRLPNVAASATLAAVSDELRNGLTTLTGSTFPIHLATGTADPALGEEGYRLLLSNGRIEIVANRDVGALYGAFALLREVQLLHLPTMLAVTSVPRVQRRMLDHWDGLNRFVERGYAGASLWD